MGNDADGGRAQANSMAPRHMGHTAAGGGGSGGAGQVESTRICGEMSRGTHGLLVVDLHALLGRDMLGEHDQVLLHTRKR